MISVAVLFLTTINV